MIKTIETIEKSVMEHKFSIGKFPPGSRDYLFRNSVYSGKFPVLDRLRGYHFCPCWHCVPCVILRLGTLTVSTKIATCKLQAKRRASDLLKETIRYNNNNNNNNNNNFF